MSLRIGGIGPPVPTRANNALRLSRSQLNRSETVGNIVGEFEDLIESRYEDKAPHIRVDSAQDQTTFVVNQFLSVSPRYRCS